MLNILDSRKQQITNDMMQLINSIITTADDVANGNYFKHNVRGRKEGKEVVRGN